MSAARTIAAVATPTGRGGVGIVRVSGTGAVDVLRALVPDWPSDTPSHKLQLCKIRGADGAVIDESLVVHFRAPNSYTGDDVVEFQCHGGPIILRGVLDACIAAGAQIAGPGEFTQRAYLNGRLDLTQAEAVADLVNATSEAAHRLALEHLQGSLGEAIGSYLAAVTDWGDAGGNAEAAELLLGVGLLVAVAARVRAGRGSPVRRTNVTGPGVLRPPWRATGSRTCSPCGCRPRALD